MADKNGLRTPKGDEWQQLPRSIEDSINKGLNVFLDNTGVARLLRYKSRAAEKIGGLKYEIENVVSRRINRGTEQRRAASNDKTLSKDAYRAYAEKNGYSLEQADNLYNQNVKRLRQLKGRKGSTLPKSLQIIEYEHLSPIINKGWGGLEHWRNIVLMPKEMNGYKSDYLPTKQAASQAGIPETIEDALRMDFEGVPRTPPKQQRSIILQDLLAQKEAGTLVRARTANNLLKVQNAAESVTKIAKNPLVRGAGLAMASIPILGDAADAATGTLGALDPNNQDKGPDQLRAAAGFTGLASLFAPVLAPVTGGLGLGSLLTDNARDRKNEKEESQKDYVNALTGRGNYPTGPLEITKTQLVKPIPGAYNANTALQQKQLYLDHLKNQIIE